ncbi:MAG: response regulator transcription factor [Acidimicrobiia bacterium]
MTDFNSRGSGDPVVESAPRVLLVDDHQMVAETLQAVLSRHGLDVTVSACASVEGILDEARSLAPKLVVLDLELGPVGHGLDLIRPLVALGTDVLVVSGLTDQLAVARCLEAGALGVVGKGQNFPALLESIRRAAEGEAVTPITERVQAVCELERQRRQEQAKLAPFQALTPRERNVLGMLVEGQSAAVIAERSYVSLATVRTQIRSIFQKLDVNSQMAAAALARNCGWRPEVGVAA